MNWHFDPENGYSKNHGRFHAYVSCSSHGRVWSGVLSQDDPDAEGGCRLLHSCSLRYSAQSCMSMVDAEIRRRTERDHVVAQVNDLLDEREELLEMLS